MSHEKNFLTVPNSSFDVPNQHLRESFCQAVHNGVNLFILVQLHSYSRLGFPLSRDFYNFQVLGLLDFFSPRTTGPRDLQGLQVLSCLVPGPRTSCPRTSWDVPGPNWKAILEKTEGNFPFIAIDKKSNLVPGGPGKSRDKRSQVPGLDRTGPRDLEGPVVPWSRD